MKPASGIHENEISLATATFALYMLVTIVWYSSTESPADDRAILDDSCLYLQRTTLEHFSIS